MFETFRAESSFADVPVASPCARWRRLVRLSLFALFLLPVFSIGRYALNGNLNEIIPGKLYRGAQPSAKTLEGLIGQLKIRTVLNVRGCCFPDDWYVGEAETCQRLGVHLEDVTFSAVHLPSRDEVRALVQVLDRAEYPIFVHCRHGSDRTGLAGVIALLLVKEQSFESARRQLGLRYGHLPFGRTTMLDRFVELYEDWLRTAKQAHSSARFRHWVLHEYRGGSCNASFEKVEPLFESPRIGQPLIYRVTVRNIGNASWQFRPLQTSGYHVTFKVLDETETMILEGRAGMLDKVVPPGEEIQVTLIVPPITTRGNFRLMVDMVEEGHCWFHQTGSQPWEEEITIRE